MHSSRTSETLADDVRAELSKRRVCVRCGAHYYEINNIGQLRCRQMYVVFGHEFSVAADHMAVASDSNDARPATHTEMRSGWVLYVYKEQDDYVLNNRVMNDLADPDPRALLVNELAHRIDAPERNCDAPEMRHHIEDAVSGGADDHLHPSLRNALCMRFDVVDDDEDDGEDDNGALDNHGEDDGRALLDTDTDFKAFVTHTTVRRYDWRAVKRIEAQIETLRARYDASRARGAQRRIPITQTPYAHDKNLMRYVFGFRVAP